MAPASPGWPGSPGAAAAPGRAAGDRMALSLHRTRPLGGSELVRFPGRDGPLGAACVGFTWHNRRAAAGSRGGFARVCRARSPRRAPKRALRRSPPLVKCVALGLGPRAHSVAERQPVLARLRAADQHAAPETCPFAVWAALRIRCAAAR